MYTFIYLDSHGAALHQSKNRTRVLKIPLGVIFHRLEDLFSSNGTSQAISSSPADQDREVIMQLILLNVKDKKCEKCNES